MNQAARTNFHEEAKDEAILPLEQLPANAVSVPTWSDSFSTAGTVYPYTMVGTDPAAGSASTHVPVEIIPLTLDFPGNCVLGHSGMAADLEASPLFSASNDFRNGATEYLDALQRGSFWSTVSTVSPDYHLLLDASDIPAVTLHVPGAQGLTISDPNTGGIDGIVGGEWFARHMDGLLNSLHIPATTLAVFVPYNTYVTDENPTDCLVSCAFYVGFHSAMLQPPSGNQPQAINTFAMASYIDDGTALPGGLDISAYVLSHEIAEWANDPFDHDARPQGGGLQFLANATPSWASPFALGCHTVLEVADPLEGIDNPFIPAGLFAAAQPVGSPITYLLADAAYLSWFARDSPSTGFGGAYDLLGLFNGYSNSC